jgi:hypothetical protein
VVFNFPAGLEHLPHLSAKLEAIAVASAAVDEIVGMEVSGSVATGTTDMFSDLDTKFVLEDASFERADTVLDSLVRAGGDAVAVFSGEHAGVPGLWIVLYDDLTHVDFHLLELSSYPGPGSGPDHLIVWERDDQLSNRLAGWSPTRTSQLEWYEARMWTWIWYTQTKILRGELYEAIDAIQFLRNSVLFPLLAGARGSLPAGSRRAEQLVGDLGPRFELTVPTLEGPATMQALTEVASLYQELADPQLEKEGIAPASEARRVVLGALEQGLDWAPETL